MREFDLLSLRLFAAACDHQNIARAAEAHHMVASAVSKRLTLLEQTAGVALLERTPRGVRPTPAGDTLLQHARVMLGSSDQAARDMAAFGAGLRGKVRLLASISTVGEFLPDDVAAYMQEPGNHDIQVDIVEALSSDIPRRLLAGTGSAGIVWDAANLDGLERRPYYSDHLGVVVLPSHPLAHRSTLAFKETLDYDQVGLPESTAGYAVLARAAALEGRTIRYRTLLSTFEAVLRVVRADLGISVAPLEIAEPYGVAFGLRVIPLTDPWAIRNLCITYVKEMAADPAALSLITFLSERRQ